jgi:hypothetical protein
MLMFADRLLVVTKTSDPAGLKFAGELDITNSSAVRELLRRRQPVVIALRLTFLVAPPPGHLESPEHRIDREWNGRLSWVKIS